MQALDDGAWVTTVTRWAHTTATTGERVVFPDGSFVVSTLYDEAGVPLRFYSSTGQPISGSALAQANIWAIAATGKGQELIAGVSRELQRIVPPGERLKMPNGQATYPPPRRGRDVGEGQGRQSGAALRRVAVAARGHRAVGRRQRHPRHRSGHRPKVADWPVPAAGESTPTLRGTRGCSAKRKSCAEPTGQITPAQGRAVRRIPGGGQDATRGNERQAKRKSRCSISPMAM